MDGCSRATWRIGRIALLCRVTSVTGESQPSSVIYSNAPVQAVSVHGWLLVMVFEANSAVGDPVSNTPHTAPVPMLPSRSSKVVVPSLLEVHKSISPSKA